MLTFQPFTVMASVEPERISIGQPEQSDSALTNIRHYTTYYMIKNCQSTAGTENSQQEFKLQHLQLKSSQKKS